MRILLLISYCLICYCASAQSVNKKQVKKIYLSLLQYYFTEQHGNILVRDSTSNTGILMDSFTGIAQDCLFPNKPGLTCLYHSMKLDSGWIEDLMEADRQKASIQTDRFPVLRVNNKIVRLINKSKLEADIAAQLKKGVIEKSPDYLQFSNVMFNANRAFVNVEMMTPDLRGHRRIFLLERRKRKWIIVAYLTRSIS